MSEEPTDPKPEAESTDSKTDESAAAAKQAAREFADNAGAMFKGLGQKMQIYLVALAVTLICSIFFSAFKFKVKNTVLDRDLTKGLSALAEAVGEATGQKPNIKTEKVINSHRTGTTSSLLGLRSFGGTFAFLGAAGGIGLLLWSTFAKRKETWIPLAIAGAAGLAALGVLISGAGLGGRTFFGSGVTFHPTILGWWLPLAAAATATTLAVQRILKA